MVVCSVLVQGSLVPTVARALRLPMRTVQPEPWALGIRLRTEPEGFHRFTISPGSPADGRTVEELADLPVDVWVSFVVRDHQLLTVCRDTTLRAGDDVLVLADDDLRERLTATFEQTETAPPPADTG
jgi:cell volume regulation protein A